MPFFRLGLPLARDSVVVLQPETRPLWPSRLGVRLPSMGIDAMQASFEVVGQIDAVQPREFVGEFLLGIERYRAGGFWFKTLPGSEKMRVLVGAKAVERFKSGDRVAITGIVSSPTDRKDDPTLSHYMACAVDHASN
ncbi:MAG TPA: hypothetical protein VGU69_10560 [Rhizomicrobium sp.]|nr:hypothetical protein [Rhizomicrobium sp.]